MYNLAKLFCYRCSDCTTATLQGARSVASSYGFSGDETMTGDTITPNQLTLQAMTDDEGDFDDMEVDVPMRIRGGDDEVSLSSGNISVHSETGLEIKASNEPERAVMLRQKSCVGSFGTDQEKPPVHAKPSLPLKPAHIRPGLKPVRIPTIDDKLVVFHQYIDAFDQPLTL